MTDKLICYIYTAFFEERNVFEMTKHAHLAEKISDNGKYQVIGYGDEYQFYDDYPEEWVVDINNEQKFIMIDYITLDPNSDQNFRDRVIKQLIRKLLNLSIRVEHCEKALNNEEE